MTEEYKDIILKYIYVKKFAWFHPIMREEFQGHLFEGRVYRDIFNPKTGNHKIPINGTSGLGFDSLVGLNEASEYEMVEITINNVLELSLVEEDIDQINKWSASDNADIKQMYAPLRSLTQALHNHNQDEAEALAIGSEALLNLWHVNSLKFEIMVDIINYLADADLDSYSDVANHIRHHPTQGRGVNITQALRALDSYNSDRRTGEDISDLYVAIEACITEYERKIENNLID